ncbi:hypothetical protein HDV02_001370 [Globomyces sp. JEL0801]|nr:hypothetical protein HDV02_001370 [Globomyces sp. JEL0801]
MIQDLPNFHIEYEPLDESLRSEIDSLQCEIQDLVVSVTQTRKSIPTSVHKILTNTVSQTTQMIEESVIHIGNTDNLILLDDTVDDAVVIEDFNIADYQDLCFKQSDLVSKIPVVQARVNQVESLLEELDIPSSSANKPHDRRKSSIGLIPKSVTPRKATVELLKRLQS